MKQPVLGNRAIRALGLHPSHHNQCVHNPEKPYNSQMHGNIQYLPHGALMTAASNNTAPK